MPQHAGCGDAAGFRKSKKVCAQGDAANRLQDARGPLESAARDCRWNVPRETAAGRCRGHISGVFRACRGRDFAFLADQSAHFGDLVSHFVSLYTTNQASAADQIRIFAEMVCQRTPTEAPANAKPLKNAAFLFSLYKIWQTKNQFLAPWSATFPKNSKKSDHLPASRRYMLKAGFR